MKYIYVITLKEYAAARDPSISAIEYSTKDCAFSVPEYQRPAETAGFTDAPLIFPIRNTITPSVAPIIRKLPPLARILIIRRNAPKNSAINFKGSDAAMFYL